MITKSHRFRPGQVTFRLLDPTTTILACASATLVRIGIDVVFPVFAGAPIPGSGVWPVIRFIAFVVPIFLLLHGRGKFDFSTAMPFAFCCCFIGSAAFGSTNLVGDLVYRGTGFWLFGTPLVWYAVNGLIIAAALFLSIKGLLALMGELSWQTRAWNLRRRSYWKLALTDAGCGSAIALALAFLAAPLSVEIRRVMDLLCLVILLVSAGLQWFVDRTGELKAPPSELSLADERRWRCEQFETDYEPTSSTDTILASRSAWTGRRLMLARIQTPGGTRWLAVGGEIRWSNQVWRVPDSVFDIMRPDLSPFLGLGPGWVVSTAPPVIRFAPEVTARLAAATERCTVFDLSEKQLRDQGPVVREAAKGPTPSPA